MAWQRIAGRLLRRDGTDGPDQAYWDPEGATVALAVWAGSGGSVRGFHLARTERFGRREWFAAWQEGRGLQVGEVDGGEAGGSRFKMSPLVRGSDRPAGEIVAGLRAYFERNAGAVEAGARRVVAGALSENAGPDT